MGTYTIAFTHIFKECFELLYRFYKIISLNKNKNAKLHKKCIEFLIRSYETIVNEINISLKQHKSAYLHIKKQYCKISFYE